MLTLLVLGESDSAGQGLADQEDAWPWQLRRFLAEATGREIELVHRKVYVEAANAADFAMKCLDDAGADLVVLSLSTHSFTIPRVALRARDRFGPRAERLCLAIERWSARLTRHGGRAGAAMHAGGRHVGRLVIGARSGITYESAVVRYAEVIRRLAARENVDILVCGGSHHAQALQAIDRKLAALNPRFNDELKAIALQHRLVWLDREALYANAPDREAAFAADGVHKSPHGHALLAQAMAAAMLGLPSVAAAAARS